MTSLEDMSAEARSGGPLAQRAAARLMTIMTDQPQRLAELLAGSRDWPQPRLVLGITGAPGSGKSTLTDRIATEVRRRRPDSRLGILAVDPSSPFTGGALLGDRVRMMRHATDPQVFIRSLASRGRLGGLALGAKGVVRVMGLIGCETVIVETVGVGQSEVEIAGNADLVLVVLAPGQGDTVQMLKAGLMEAGELFVVNKADRPDAERLHQQLLTALETSYFARHDLSFGADEKMDCNEVLTDPPKVLLCSAAEDQGIAELVDELERLAELNAERWLARREEQAVEEVRQAVIEEVRLRVLHAVGDNNGGPARLRGVLAGSESLDTLVDNVLVELAAPN
ncbi:putative GTPase ArgK [Posidoniimonas polymericola]|uniref:Putative GTPase ArgK n=1 Tax=Posidoniimonas polymericola TaxID=2528002 RepID=A0A5C5XVP7_9BACT|nr:methylmalonyl Co-A mutase-associated GTPase MeaB [Posidoniimonas polymericola]TWT66970.1 putative GTPase ArgK [Posidoniimonas polymericola]